MDLLDFTGEDMYFDRPLPAGVARLLDEAAERYGEEIAECRLLRAYLLAPEHLAVLVALYRYFYYQQRYEDALLVAERAVRVAARELGLEPNWQGFDAAVIRRSTEQSMSLTRFLLLALKGAGYLQMRLGDSPGAMQRFELIASCDSRDRLGVRDLLTWAKRAVAEEQARTAGSNVLAFRQ